VPVNAITLTHYYGRQPKSTAEFANRPNDGSLGLGLFDQPSQALVRDVVAPGDGRRGRAVSRGGGPVSWAGRAARGDRRLGLVVRGPQELAPAESRGEQQKPALPHRLDLSPPGFGGALGGGSPGSCRLRFARPGGSRVASPAHTASTGPMAHSVLSRQP